MSVVLDRRDATPADVYTAGSWEAYKDAVETENWTAMTPKVTATRARMMRWLRENKCPDVLTTAIMRGDASWDLLQALVFLHQVGARPLLHV